MHGNGIAGLMYGEITVIVVKKVGLNVNMRFLLILNAHRQCFCSMQALLSAMNGWNIVSIKCSIVSVFFIDS